MSTANTGQKKKQKIGTYRYIHYSEKDDTQVLQDANEWQHLFVTIMKAFFSRPFKCHYSSQVNGLIGSPVDAYNDDVLHKTPSMATPTFVTQASQASW